MNDFPKLGINTKELIDSVDALLLKAKRMRRRKADEFGAVNWGDLRIVDIEYRLSMLDRSSGPLCVVLVEEASPHCGLATWLTENLDISKFPRTHIECEW